MIAMLILREWTKKQSIGTRSKNIEMKDTPNISIGVLPAWPEGGGLEGISGRQTENGKKKIIEMCVGCAWILQNSPNKRKLAKTRAETQTQKMRIMNKWRRKITMKMNRQI